MVIGDFDESAAPGVPPRNDEKRVTAFCRSAPPEEDEALEPPEPLEPVEPEFELLLLLPHAPTARASATDAVAMHARRPRLLVIDSPLVVTGSLLGCRRRPACSPRGDPEA